MSRINLPIFFRQAVKDKLVEWVIPPSVTDKLVNSYNTLEGSNALFSLESYINGGYSTDEALREVHKGFPKLALFKSSNELAEEALKQVSAKADKKLLHQFAALAHLAKTDLYGEVIDPYWVDVRLAGYVPSLFILDNYAALKSSIGSRTEEWSWLTKRSFYKIKFGAALLELPPDIESQLPDAFVFYRALEKCYQTDNFYIHESVLPDKLRKTLSNYYNEEFINVQ